MKKVIFIFLFLATLGMLFLNVDDEVKFISSDEVEIKDVINSHNTNEGFHIKINGTNIDTYIMQGGNNNYYLNHNYKNEEDIDRVVFLDYRNNLNDKKLLIYGHNSKDRDYAIFKDLEKYKDNNFYKKYSYIEITFNNIKYNYKIFSVMITKVDDYNHTKVNFKDGSYLEHLKYLKDNSIYDTETEIFESDRIITLQTCNYDPEGSYLLVNARRE